MGKDAFQALAFFVGGDLAADSYMRNGWHEDEESAWKRNVAGDASALLCDRFLGDLDKDFLTGFEEIGDDG